MNKYIEVGYVETSPLECNVCFNDIEKGEIMIGEQKKGTKSNFSWRHLDCMMLTAVNKQLDPEDIKGLTNLTKNDQRIVKQRIQLLKERTPGEPLPKKQLKKLNKDYPLSKGVHQNNKTEKSNTASSRSKSAVSKKSKSRSKSKGFKNKSSNNLGVVTRSMRAELLRKQGIQPPARKVRQIYAFQPKPIPKKKGKTRPKTANNKEDRKKSKSKPRKQKSQRKQKKANKSQSRSKSKSKSKSKPTRSPSAKKRKVKIAPQYSAPTKSEERQYNRLINKYIQLTGAELKQLLGHNKLPKSGVKQQLAARIAGAIMFGKISKCPSCGGGNPRLFFDKLTFICPGYMDDDHFRHCKKHFKVGKIQTQLWDDMRK